MNKIAHKLKSLNIDANDSQLFLNAFTHSTFANENFGSDSYETLEFLGDAILGKVVCEYIYNNHFSNEGKMSLLKIEAVKGNTLTYFALKEGFDRLIRIGNTKEKINNNKKVLEDVFEAFIGALYLDQGETKVLNFLSRNIFKHIDEMFLKELKNPKTILQEFLQGERRGEIKYQTLKHSNYFYADVFWDDQLLGSGKGVSKKDSEVKAAQSALRKVGKK